VWIDILGWSLFGFGLIFVYVQAVDIWRIDHPRPPSGRHSAPSDTSPNRAKEWQGLRGVMMLTLMGPAIVLLGLGKSPRLTQDPARWLAVLAAVIIVIWEINSWRGIADPTARRRALNSARSGLIPGLIQITVLAGIWTNGPARIVAVTLGLVIVIGPDVESWVRRWLIRRASDATGGSTPS
jgi:hypothetical protein